MTVRECILNNVPMWRLRLTGWRLRWTKENISDKVQDEIFYIKNNSIYKSYVGNFKHSIGNFVWSDDVVNEELYKESMNEKIDEKETIKCLFKFYHLLSE